MRNLKTNDLYPASRTISLMFVTSLISACGMFGYTYEPTFFAQPKFYKNAEIAEIEMPDIPSQEVTNVEYMYKSESELPRENSHFTYTDKKKALINATSPTVMVILPSKSSPLTSAFDRKLVESSLSENGFTVKSSSKINNGNLPVKKQLNIARKSAKYALLVSELDAVPRSYFQNLDLNQQANFGRTEAELKEILPSDKHFLIKTKISAPGYQTRFKAKLIDLATDSIVWIGRYSQNSSDIKEFQITYTITKFTTNERQIIARVSHFNEQLSAHSKQLSQAKSDYESTFADATTPKEFKEEGEMLLHKSMVKKAYRKAEQHYIRTYEAGLRLPEQKEKVESNITWTYGYNLTEPKVSPSLEALSQPPIVATQSSHLQRLLESTVRPIIKAIKG